MGERANNLQLCSQTKQTAILTVSLLTVQSTWASYQFRILFLCNWFSLEQFILLLTHLRNVRYSDTYLSNYASHETTGSLMQLVNVDKQISNASIA